MEIYDFKRAEKCRVIGARPMEKCHKMKMSLEQRCMEHFGDFTRNEKNCLQFQHAIVPSVGRIPNY